MFYCETCRFVNSWPQGIFRSGGKCEVCGHTATCYDVRASHLPEHKPVKQVMMTLQDDKGFSLDGFIAQRTMKVLKVVQRTDKMAVVNIVPGDAACPTTDPIMFGSVVRDSRYVVRILWDNQLWRPYESDVTDLLTSISRSKKH